MADLLERVRAGGLLGSERPVLVLLSGGRDSVCLLDVAVRLAPDVEALHCNYGLRAEAGADEAHCAALCERLGVTLHVHRPRGPSGNLQAWARDRRYAEAERLATRRHRAPATRRPTRWRPSCTGSRARPGGGPCSAWPRARAGSCGRCCGVDARGDRRPLRRARAAVARGRLQRRPRVRPQPRPRHVAPRAARAAPGGRGQRPAHARPAARRGRRARRRARRRAGRGRRSPRRRRAGRAAARPAPARPPAPRRPRGERAGARGRAIARRRCWRSARAAPSISAAACARPCGGGALTFGPSVGRAAPRRGAAPS